MAPLAILEAEIEGSEGPFEHARQAIARALMLGKLQAQGRKGIEASGVEPVYLTLDPINEPDHYTCCEWEAEYGDVPADFWQVRRILWDDSVVRHEVYATDDAISPVVAEYVDVRIATAELIRVFPAEPASGGAKNTRAPAKKRGPKDKYDMLDFYLHCVLEAETNGRFTREADFVRRMPLLLSVAWGEGHTPGDTWLKERYGELENCRDHYDRRRRELDV